MAAAGFDTETHLIEPGLLAPPLVCVSSAVELEGGEPGTWARPGGIQARLFHAHKSRMPRGHLGPPVDHADAREHFRWLLQQDPLFTLHGAYDMAVCLAKWPDLAGEIFAAYDDDRVIDVGLCQRLIDNASGTVKDHEGKRGGGYSLQALERRHFDLDRREQKGPDAWRLRYRELEDVDLHRWPVAAVEYPLDDARGPLRIGLWQLQHHEQLLRDAPAQARAAFALQLLMCWGVMTDKKRIKRLKDESERYYSVLSEKLVHYGLVRPADAKKGPGTRDTKAAKRHMVLWCRMHGLPVKLTDKGWETLKERAGEVAKGKANEKIKVEDVFSKADFEEYASVDEDACKESGDPVMIAYSRRVQVHTIVHTHVPDLLKGVKTPIQPSYSTMVDSGRTSCGKGKGGSTNGFQFQNPKKSLDYFPPGVGVRECFIARPGRLFADPDFGGLELCTGAQACIATVGYSRLADAINAGRDPHLQFGARLMGIDYEEARARRHEKIVKHFRGLAKPFLFGRPGALGVESFVGYAQGYGVKLTRDECKRYFKEWEIEFPEWLEYFEFIRKHVDRTTGLGQIEQLYVGRIRGGIGFPALCNTTFQGLGADGAKSALYEVAKHCYVPGLDPVLYGARPVGFVHDEIPAEVFEEVAHEQTMRMCAVMEDACNKFLPDVPVKAVPTLCKRWGKDNEAVYDEHGRLQAYDLARAAQRVVYYDAAGKEQVDWDKIEREAQKKWKEAA